MLTPFRENGKIDFPALEVLIEFYLNAGANGLFANCLSSEMFHLNRGERMEVTRFVLAVVNGRVPVVSTGTFSRDRGENSDFMGLIHDMGVASVVVNANQLCNEDDGDDVFRAGLEVLLEDTGDMPLGLYECPVPYKRRISDRVFSWIASTGRFSYFKDTSCDDRIIASRIEMSAGSGLSLFNANTPTAYQSLMDGAAGISPIGANFYPELYHYLFDHFWEESETVLMLRRFLTVADLVVHALYPYSAKYFLRMRGLPLSLHSRTPVPGPGREDLIRLRELHALMADAFAYVGLNYKHIGLQA